VGSFEVVREACYQRKKVGGGVAAANQNPIKIIL